MHQTQRARPHMMCAFITLIVYTSRHHCHRSGASFRDCCCCSSHTAWQNSLCAWSLALVTTLLAAILRRLRCVHHFLRCPLVQGAAYQGRAGVSDGCLALVLCAINQKAGQGQQRSCTGETATCLHGQCQGTLQVFVHVDICHGSGNLARWLAGRSWRWPCSCRA